MRTRIALRNLYISQGIIFLFLIFAYFVWFPHPFTRLGGFEETAYMLILVDIVLGPLLVFIVYKEDKKYLAFDINILLAIQLIAFIFGAYSLYQKRPTYAAFINGHFELVNASYANPKQIRFESLKTSFFSQPQIAYTKAPENIQGLLQFIVDVNSKDKEQIDKLAKYYEPLEKHLKKVLTRKLDPKVIFSNERSRLLLIKFMKKYGGSLQNYAFFPLTGSNNQTVILALDINTAQAIGIIEIDFSKLLPKEKRSLPHV